MSIVVCDAASDGAMPYIMADAVATSLPIALWANTASAMPKEAIALGIPTPPSFADPARRRGRHFRARAAHPPRAVGPHSAQYDREQAWTVHVGERGHHWVDRRHAAACHRLVCEKERRAAFGQFHGFQMRIARRDYNPTRATPHPIDRHIARTLGEQSDLYREIRHKRFL
jgi:hypothetical protein